jgi:hypothetical protein
MPKKFTVEQQRAIDTLARLVETPAHLGFNADGEPTEIQLFQRGVTDREMECFRYFTEFKSIGVGENDVTDVGVRHLAHLRKLTFLDLWNTQITDAGLESLKDMHDLQHLNVGGCPITDVGIRHLERLKKLKKLGIDEEGFTDEAYQRLLSAIPGLEIASYL